MQLISKEEKSDDELRSKIKDNRFIEQMKSQLIPGIENSEQRFKVHQFTQSALMLPDFNDYARLKPLIDGLIDEVNPRDFLGCSTALEILAEIASSRRANICYFEQIGLLSKIYDLFQFTKQNPDLGLIHIACIRFFGYLSTADPNSLTKFPVFAADVFDAVYRFDSLDIIRRKLAFETLAIVTTTSGAKEFLASHNCPYNINKALNNLGSAVATGAGMPELKAAYLDAIHTIFNSFDPNSPIESSQILRSWFSALGEPFPRLLLQCLQTPIPEIQTALLQLMLALMRHAWMPAYFCQIDSFLKFLLDRQAKFTSFGYQLKYDLVCRLIDSQSPHISPDDMEKLRQYASMGVYAPPAKVDIATEQAS